jgi:uncharacterized membrane protein
MVLKSVRAHAALAAALALAASAASAGVTDAPTIQVRPDPGGASGDITGVVDIAAPAALVWRIMTDCAQVSRMMASVKSCRVLDRDPAGRWDVREQITSPSLLPAVRTVMRSDYDAPRLVRFHQVSGDFKVLEGTWRLQPTDGGRDTRVTYESRVTPPFAAPGFLVRAVLRRDLPRTLLNLRAASEAANRAGG